jgi:hypothetical protein
VRSNPAFCELWRSENAAAQQAGWLFVGLRWLDVVFAWRFWCVIKNKSN